MSLPVDRLVPSSAAIFHTRRGRSAVAPLASVGRARHMCAVMPVSRPIAVERLVKIYKTMPAVDGISFTLAPGIDHRAARRQRRRQDHHHRHHHGPGHADIRPRHRARRRDAGAALPRAASHEFRKPLRRSADAAHGAAELDGVRQALRRRGSARTHRAAWRASSTSPICSTARPASSRPDRRRACRSPRR